VTAIAALAGAFFHRLNFDPPPESTTGDQTERRDSEGS